MAAAMRHEDYVREMDAIDDKILALSERADEEGREPTREEQREIQQLIGAKEHFRTLAHAAYENEPQPRLAPGTERPIARSLEEAEAISRGEIPGLSAGRGGGRASGGWDTPRIVTPGGDPLARFEVRRGDFASLFPKANLRDNGGFPTLGDFLGPISRHESDRRLKPMAAHSSQSGSDGGYLKPIQFAAELMDEARTMEIVRRLARVHAMTSGEKRVAGLKVDKSLGSKMIWLAEGAEASEDSYSARMFSLVAKKGAIFTKAPRELLNDSDFEPQLRTAMSETIAAGLDRAFFNGTGAGEPLGILNDPAALTLTRDTSNQIAAADVYKMFSRHYRPGRGVWVANQSAFPQIATLKDEGNNSLFIQNAAQGIPGTMLGQPLLFSEELPSLGTTGDLTFIDFSQYAIGLRQEMTIESSIAPGWQTDEVAFRSIVRIDGQGTWDQAYTPVNGDSLSWAVILDSSTS